MIRDLPRRKRHIVITGIVAAATVLTGTIAIWISSGPEDTYRPGEEIAGLTSTLERSLPADYPRVSFTDVSREAGVDFVHFSGERTSRLPEDMGSGAAWGDYDDDGYQDLYVVNIAGNLEASASELKASRAASTLYHNNGDGTFTNVGAKSGVALRTLGMAAAWGDYDSDGRLDLVVTSYGRNAIFRNSGDGTFTDVSRETGVGLEEGFWAGAAWGDYDRDGRLDLYVAGYVQFDETVGDASSVQYDVVTPSGLNPSSFPPERNLLYHNLGDGHFEEIALRTGVQNAGGRSLSAAWVDLDEDGWTDLYVANDVSDNALFRNRGDGTFEDISHQALVADYRGAMGIAVGDWDGDLDIDLFLTHWIAQENALYSNTRSDRLRQSGKAGLLQFMDVADRFGVGQIALDFIGWGTSFVDYDNDGRPDLFVINGSTFQRNEDFRRLVPMTAQLFWNRSSEEGFFDVSSVAGEYFKSQNVGRGAAFADFDNDGDMDAFVVNHGGRGALLRNDGGNRKAWLELALRGRKSGTSAVGAKIRIVAGGTTQIRQSGAQASYCSQNGGVEHFGLGDASLVDTVEITWPSGSVEVGSNLAANQILKWVEGEPPSGRASVASFWEVYRSASSLRASGRFGEAAEAYRRALALNPEHEDALYYLGNMYLELGELEKAADEWRRLAKVDPHSSRAHTRLGDLRFCFPESRLYDLASAESAYRKALAINKEETGPVLRLGLVNLASGDLKSARDHLAAVAATNASSLAAQFFLGYTAWKSGDRRLASTQFALALSLQEARGSTPGPVKGEGDTRQGSRPLRSEELGCPALEPFLQNLQQEGETASYRRLDSFFTAQRPRTH